MKKFISSVFLLIFVISGSSQDSTWTDDLISIQFPGFINESDEQPDGTHRFGLSSLEQSMFLYCTKMPNASPFALNSSSEKRGFYTGIYMGIKAGLEEDGYNFQELRKVDTIINGSTQCHFDLKLISVDTNYSGGNVKGKIILVENTLYTFEAFSFERRYEETCKNFLSTVKVIGNVNEHVAKNKTSSTQSMSNFERGEAFGYGIGVLSVIVFLIIYLVKKRKKSQS